MNPLRFLAALSAAIAGWMALMWFVLLAVSTAPEARRDGIAEPAAAPAAEAPAAPSAITSGHLGVRLDAGGKPAAEDPAAPALGELEQRYLACSRAAMARVLGLGEAAQCSMLYERLLSERFGGNFERLLQWSRSTHRADDHARTLFEAAQSHHDNGRFADAYELFARLADCGHREATRMALQMRRLGPQLYGQAFDASVQQMARWQSAMSLESDGGPVGCTQPDPQARTARLEPVGAGLSRPQPVDSVVR